MKVPLFRILICIVIFGVSLFSYIERKNELTGLRLYIPKIEKELRSIQQGNIRLHYDIERFESPVHLMELSRKPEYGHLKHPYTKDVVELNAY